MLRAAISLAACVLLAGSAATAGDVYGHVEFANSGATAAQADFLSGLALLHDFEYDSAAAAFRRAEALDPGFAMAYWGEAMTHNHPVWMEQDLAAARAVLNKLAPTGAQRRTKAKTEREAAYWDALETLYADGTKEERDLRYEALMAKLHARYPDDVDAAAFYGLSILGSAHGGRDTATYMRAAAVLEEAWMNHREHPGLLHYLIHSYDDPIHAPLGLRAARLYAKIAPDAGHAQHMTSHIFLALGMWPEVIDANVAGIADADRARAARGAAPVRCGHYESWLGYAYLQLAQTDQARSRLESCRASLGTDTAMKHGGMSMDPDDSAAGSFANMRLRYLLDTHEWGGEIAAWSLPATSGPGARLDFAFARAMGEIAQAHEAAARTALNQLESAGREVIDIETKRGDSDPSYRVRPQILLLEARGLFLEQQKDFVGAEKLLRHAVELEDTLPIAFGPPLIDKPTHELWAEFLLRRGRMGEAHQEFEKALALTPGRRAAELGFTASRSPADR
jgi:tetratricopeptide (TPR) repeat protein